MNPRFLAAICSVIALCAVPAAELTPSETELQRQLGPGTPDPLPLWPERPPGFVADAAPEQVVEHARIRSVSIPTLTPYLPPKESATGMALVVCAATTDQPVEIAKNIVADLQALGVPARLDLFEEGGHGVGNLIPTRVLHGFPPAKWPQHLLLWLNDLPHGSECIQPSRMSS